MGRDIPLLTETIFLACSRLVPHPLLTVETRTSAAYSMHALFCLQQGPCRRLLTEGFRSQSQDLFFAYSPPAAYSGVPPTAYNGALAVGCLQRAVPSATCSVVQGRE